jgi:uncharacterized protein (TIGR02145 family)
MKKILSLLIIILTPLSACKKNALPEQTIGINGTLYKTGIFGSKTWTTENYRGPGGVDLANNNTAYGKVYTIAEAKLITPPQGWRIPTIYDYYDLLSLTGAGDRRLGYMGFNTAQILSLMSATGWDTQNGTNTTGFNAFPAGFYIKTAANTMVWQNAKSLSVFLTTTSTEPNISRVFAFGVDAAGSPLVGNMALLQTIDDRASLRFVKDNQGV